MKKKNSISILIVISFMITVSILVSPINAQDFFRQMGIAGDMSACDAVGGKATATINDPAKLIAAGMNGANAGDKLEITRVSVDQIMVKNVRTGSTVKLGYGYEEGGVGGSGYFGKETPDAPVMNK